MSSVYHKILSAIGLAVLLSACGSSNALLKTTDYEYRYEAAKALYAEGSYRQAAEHLSAVLAPLKGTQYGEESLYMLAESNFRARDFESAAMFFKKYYQMYPKGAYAQRAYFNSGFSLYMQTVDVRLDQSATVDAITEFQDFLDYYPQTVFKEQAQDIIYRLQDRLVEKEYLTAKLYYDLGAYMGNATYGGSNYEACVVTCQNALKDYPYASTNLREDLAVMTLRAKHLLAIESVEERKAERLRDAIDEYYAFINDYPESKYLEEAKVIFDKAQKDIDKRGGYDDSYFGDYSAKRDAMTKQEAEEREAEAEKMNKAAEKKQRMARLNPFRKKQNTKTKDE